VKNIITFSGKDISLETGIPSIEDIALSYCRTVMYAGQTKLFYSVAHHVILTAQFMPNHKIFGLLHESETCCFSDVPGPMKTVDLKKYELSLRNRILASLNLIETNEIHNLVEMADKLELSASSRVIGLPNCDKYWEFPELKYLDEVNLILHNFPPENQLRYNSDLMKHFIYLFNYYLQNETSVLLTSNK